MLLKDRVWSYQWSQIERKLFNKENIGFVRPVDSQGIVFFLDPSPFLPTQNKIFYVAKNTPPPKAGDLIRVTVQSEEEDISRDKRNNEDGSPAFHREIYKFINKWEKIDPNSLATKTKILEPYEVMEFFKAPFIGEETYVQRASTCAALSFLSAPPITHNNGGINTAVLGKPKFWKSFERTMNVIPTEFKRQSSDYYYVVSKTEKQVQPADNKEVNLSFHNPEFTPMHIPIVMNPDPDFTGPKYQRSYVKENEHLIPFVVSYLLDSLLFSPDIPLTEDKLLTDCTYEINHDLAASGVSPCNFDLGSALPKMSMAFGRLNSEMIVKSEFIKSSKELWKDMLYDAKKIHSTPFHVEDIFKMSDDERRLYVHLVDVFGIEHLAPEQEFINSLGAIRMSRDQYDKSIEILNRFGLVLRYPNNIMKLLDTVKPKIIP